MVVRSRKNSAIAHFTRYRLQRRLVLYWLAIFFLANLFGSHRDGYKASSLPPQLAAPVVNDVQRLNFLRLGGATSHDTIFFPGDTVQVATVSGGGDERPQPWDLQLSNNRNVHVLDALAQASGPKYSTWIADKLTVIRPVPCGDETATINVSIREAIRDNTANGLHASGDIVSIEENAMTFTLGTLGHLIGIGASAATVATRFVP